MVDGGRLERRYQLAIRFQPAYGTGLFATHSPSNQLPGDDLPGFAQAVSSGHEMSESSS